MALIVIIGLVGGVFLVASGDPEGADERAQPPGEPCPPADGSGERKVAFSRPPSECIDPARSYLATVETDVGTFTIDLDTQATPKTVNNFVFLARNHYFDGVPFHRVVPGFVVQGGDGQRGDGTGGPGYTIPDELPEPGQYQMGAVAMANSGPNTSGSQFFVVTGQNLTLPPRYSLFGKVANGFEVVQKIEADGSPDPDPPKVVHKMLRITIAESGD